MYSIIFLVITAIHAKLNVITPNELALQFVKQNNSIPYGVANFGHIPWGRKLLGAVMIADPIDACLPVKAQPHLESEKPFVLVQRGGGCTFVTKVNNVQLMTGAALVIIMDNSIERTETYVMSDDGFGYKVSVPSIFIRETDGELIQKFVEDSDKQKPEENPKIPKHVMLAINFDVVKSDTTSVYLGLSFQDRESFKLVADFEQYYLKLQKDKVLFKVFYDLFPCVQCRAQQYKVPQQDCLGGGLYCQLDPDGVKPGNGRQVLEEQLRQICIFQTNPELWWKYVPSFDKNCVLVQAYESCSSSEMKLLKIDEVKVSNCIRNSYNTSSNGDRSLQTNYLLEEQKQFKYNSGLRFYPGAVINNQSYLGRIDAQDIFGEVCNSMNQHPSYCQEYFDQDYNKAVVQDSNITTIILVVLLVLIVFFLFMVFIYRRMVRKEMSKEMSTQVNQMVSQYISFYEAKDKKDGN